MWHDSILGFCVLALVAVPVRAADPPVDFARDVLPILSDNCFHCHGPDEKARKAKLRLDTKEGAFRVRDGEAVIVPGKSAESELVRRITADDPDEVMPPPKSNRKLTPQQIETLKRWVDQGAKWGQHWAFVAAREVRRSRSPPGGWSRDPIDALRPRPAGDRRG